METQKVGLSVSPRAEGEIRLARGHRSSVPETGVATRREIGAGLRYVASTASRSCAHAAASPSRETTSPCGVTA